jgi:hypothetical protein
MILCWRCKKDEHMWHREGFCQIAKCQCSVRPCDSCSKPVTKSNAAQYSDGTLCWYSHKACASNAQQGIKIMKWSKTQPTEPGFYWFKYRVIGTESEFVTIVKIFYDCDQLLVREPENIMPLIMAFYENTNRE